ncbi:uncharacterized protein LOC121872698 [Homarus americanus]|uniref:Protein sleepless n=1 Tax=Homarus americanus TaxID=6706 RepID=A0A8J5MU39_HOMAM|nr:uncharacterized protein LOC121872698 [Homarus americanus]KAG7163671.1 hypothetical protein Hamer_G002895 [Homarus americanus]
MLPSVVLVLVILAGPGRAGDPRVCYKCRAKDHCLDLDTSAIETCSPDVKLCVKKETFSRVTGVVVTERYCSGRDILDSGKELVEEKCYPANEEGRRTSATVCYCSDNYCNGTPPRHSLTIGPLLLCLLVPALML